VRSVINHQSLFYTPRSSHSSDGSIETVLGPEVKTHGLIIGLITTNQEDEGVEESDGGISRASFVSGKEIYLSRAEILGKIHDSAPSKKVPKKSEKERPPRNGLSRHDSWSSRASSILKDPEAIYVSRVELLKKIDVHEEPRHRGGNKTRAQVKQHDSWSSRASSILAAVEAEKATLEDDEPLYISRVELLEKLQLKSLAALSAASGTSAESDLMLQQ